MLTSLRFENIALLDSQQLNFQKGFTVITGETGAGKSILLDCLDLLLGSSQLSKASRFLIKHRKSFLIEGVFDITESLQSWLNQQHIEYDDNEIIITREWRLNDARLKSRCRVNGIHVNLKQINQLRSLLVDFTFQNNLYKIDSPLNQLKLLDSISNEFLKKAKETTKESWLNWLNISNELKDVKYKLKKSQEEYNEDKEILDVLETLNLSDPNEYEDLKIRQDKLFNSVCLKEGIEKILFILNGSEPENSSVIEQISLCIHDLKLILNKDISLKKIYEQSININNYLNDFVRSLEDYVIDLESDPLELDNVQIRMNDLQKIQRRFGLDLEGLIRKRNELSKNIYLNDVEKKYSLLIKEEEIARCKRDENNLDLSRLRIAAARSFQQSLMKALTPLGLSNVRFQVEISTCDPSENGSDLVKFLFSANPGHPLLPLEEVASGGEMSRFVLALKTIFSQVSPSKIFVFDEIDSGVSGKISKAIAALLKDLAKKEQVFCVTHQPLVAAVANNHFSVNKFVRNGLTFSKITELLDKKAKQKELAELAGGDDTDANLYAASLLEQQAA